MQILLYLTDFIVPLVIFGIVGYGLLMKVPVYDTFIKGAKKGFLTVIKIMPTRPRRRKVPRAWMK